MENSISPGTQTVVKITDAHLSDLYTNQALAELSGYDPQELEQLGWLNIVEPQARSLFEEIVRSVGKTPYVRECFDTNILCCDGSTRTLVWDVISLSPGRFPLMLITAHESAQKRLPGSAFLRTRQVSLVPSGWWEAVFDALPDCVSVHDENFTVMAANRALCERLDLERSEIVGRKCHEVFHGLGQPVGHCVLVRAMSGRPGERVRREAYERQFKGVCQAEAVAFTPGKSGARAVIHTLRTSESSELGLGAASQRYLDGLSRLAGAIAHDYNNLLSGIVGYMGMLEMLPNLPAKARHYVAELEKATSRLNEMTQRLLLFGRRRILHPQSIDLRHLVAETLRSTDVVPDSRTVHYEMPEQPVRAHGDPLQIGIVLGNLVRNALEATAQSDGEVVVRTLLRSPSKPFATFFSVAPAGKYACIDVRDTGSGIEPDRLVHIFEPFGQPDNRSLGCGLGLAIVYRIVSNHGGHIEAESEPGLGTRITVLIPASSETT